MYSFSKISYSSDLRIPILSQESSDSLCLGYMCIPMLSNSSEKSSLDLVSVHSNSFQFLDSRKFLSILDLCIPILLKDYGLCLSVCVCVYLLCLWRDCNSKLVF